MQFLWEQNVIFIYLHRQSVNFCF